MFVADVMARTATTKSANSPESSSASESKLLLDRDEVAAKIQKLLKSQWEERLKRFNVQQQQQQQQQQKVEKSSEENSHYPQQKLSLQKSSKSILRKARFQINKKTLLKIRQPENFQNLFTSVNASNSLTTRSKASSNLPTQRKTSKIPKPKQSKNC
jgi:putative alpha-1,2-mannosidase